ncbi:MAG: hypothetical protein AAFP00_05790 [Bacteroidota bacterium]
MEQVNTHKTYQPINCNYYDELEAMATFRKVVDIQYYLEDGSIETIQGQIVDFRVVASVEFMILKSGQEIRLDYLVSADGKEVPGAC